MLRLDNRRLNKLYICDYITLNLAFGVFCSTLTVTFSGFVMYTCVIIEYL